MEKLQKTEKQEKGLLLKGTLILTFLGELFLILASLLLISVKDEAEIVFDTLVEDLLFAFPPFVLIVVGIFSFYAIYTTSKMKKNGAYCLLGVYIIDFIIFTFYSYIEIRYNLENQSFFILTALICLLLGYIVWKNLKKMN